MLSLQALHHGIEIKSQEFNKGNALLLIDSQRVRQVLVNLLQNSIKFSKRLD
jgi:two-component system cell cycle sensor histidine kinase PleC